MKRTRKVNVELWDIDGKYRNYTIPCSSKADCMKKFNSEYEGLRRLKADGEVIDFNVTASL